MMAQHVPRDDPMNEDDEEELEALEAAANAALAAADALMNPSVEQEAAEMARIKQRAKEHGVNPVSVTGTRVPGTNIAAPRRRGSE